MDIGLAIVIVGAMFCLAPLVTIIGFIFFAAIVEYLGG